MASSKISRVSKRDALDNKALLLKKMRNRNEKKKRRESESQVSLSNADGLSIMSGVPSLSPSPSVHQGDGPMTADKKGLSDGKIREGDADKISVASSARSYGKRDALENRALAMKKMKDRALKKIQSMDRIKSENVSVTGGEESNLMKTDISAEGIRSDPKIEAAKMEKRR
jgi:hypothetical protein